MTSKTCRFREPFTAALAALDMQTLSETSDEDLPGLLTALADAYEAWIARQELRIADPAARLHGFDGTSRAITLTWLAR